MILKSHTKLDEELPFGENTYFASMSAVKNSANGLFDSLATALAFPDYFGRNWDALDECLGDLEWINKSVVCLEWKDALEWAKRNPKQFVIFLDVLDNAIESLGNTGKTMTLIVGNNYKV